MEKNANKLSLKRKLRFAFSVKTPVRLVFTLLITIFTLTLTGICFLFAFYDRDFAIHQTFLKGRDYFELARNGGQAMSFEELQQLSADIHAPFGLYTESYEKMICIEFELDKTNLSKSINTHFSVCSRGYAYFGKEFFREGEFAAGGVPENYNEIAISVCNAKAILISEGLPEEDYSSLLGKRVHLLIKNNYYDLEEEPQEEAFVISGVYRNHCDYTKGYMGFNGTFNMYDYMFPGCSTANESAPFECYTLFSEEYFLDQTDRSFKRAYFAKQMNDDFIHGFLDRVENSTEYHANLLSIKYYEKVDELCRKFIFPAVGFAVFVELLIYQLTEISIERKRRMIGCLRAIGCGGGDILQIFLIENLFIGLTAGSISCGLLALSVPIANRILMARFSVDVSFLIYPPMAFVLVFLLGIVGPLLSAFLPALLESRRYPIESIKSDS